MDLLSDLMRVLRVKSYGSVTFDAGGDWKVGIAAHRGMKILIIVQGTCSVVVEGCPAIEVGEGDCLFTTRGRPLEIRSLGADDAERTSPILPPSFDGGMITHNGGGDFLAVGGFFTLADTYLDLFLNGIPPVVEIGRATDRDVIEWCVGRLTTELRKPGPGTGVIAEQLVTMMLIHSLRAAMEGDADGRLGWLAASADPQLRAAIEAMHGRPEHRWTLPALAAHAGMSRTIFAVRFKAVMGVPPMDYLTQWRMLLASDRLRIGSEPAAEIGRSVGYDCERAFARAFKRGMGCSPRQYRLRSRGGSEAGVVAANAGRMSLPSSQLD